MLSKSRMFAIVFFVLAVIVHLTPKLIAPVCAPMEDGSFMKCHWTGEGVFYVGIVMILMSVIHFLIKSEAVKLGISIASVLVGLYAILLPTHIIGTCKMHTMACNTSTKPVVLLVSSIYVLVNLVYIFLFRKKAEN